MRKYQQNLEPRFEQGIVQRTPYKQDMVNPALMLIFFVSNDYSLYPKVTRLVKEVNCQYTFGVFTKWDECTRKAQESEDTVDLEQARKDCKQNFEDALEKQCEVFFVDVRCENNNYVCFLFLFFYSMLLCTECYYA